MQLLKVLKFVIHLEIHLFRQHQGSRLTGAGVPVACSAAHTPRGNLPPQFISMGDGRQRGGGKSGCCRAAEFALPLLTFTLSARTELNEATLTL